ncbi:hypothetical protein F4678DRAFT_159500 [Xylaria arbuscula]|nr:hypothetical protein F4678DRAFT_159500 [Xylaria arbuscula]
MARKRSHSLEPEVLKNQKHTKTGKYGGEARYIYIVTGRRDTYLMYVEGCVRDGGWRSSVSHLLIEARCLVGGSKSYTVRTYYAALPLRRQRWMMGGGHPGPSAVETGRYLREPHNMASLGGTDRQRQDCRESITGRRARRLTRTAPAHIPKAEHGRPRGCGKGVGKPGEDTSARREYKTIASRVCSQTNDYVPPCTCIPSPPHYLLLVSGSLYLSLSCCSSRLVSSKENKASDMVAHPLPPPCPVYPTRACICVRRW